MLQSHAWTALAMGLLLPGAACAQEPSAEQVRTALARATQYLTSISTEGGYLWRYSADLKERWGEDRATDTQVWVQPPGTPSVGKAFLEAYRATGDEIHLRAARDAALALVRGQLESGGWEYAIEFDPVKRRAWAFHSEAPGGGPDSRRNTTVFDDNNTQSALRFLLDFVAIQTNETDAETKVIRDALRRGLTRMSAAQYPNGAWPQRWDGRPHDPARHPIRKASIPRDWPRTWPHDSYSSYYTLNDGAQLDCIETMLEAFHQLGDREWLEAARRGGDFLILAQLPEPQPGWAQQYNFAMEPAWARAFEPPAICSSESVVAMRTLVNLFIETGDAKYLEPIPRFASWLERSRLGPDRWARLYELGSNKPLYGDRDGLIHYTLEEISAERQRGYSWQGSYDIPQALKYYQQVLTQGRDTWLKRRQSPGQPSPPSLTRVARILKEQDAQGRWLGGGAVDMQTFIQNMRLLSAHLTSRADAEP